MAASTMLEDHSCLLLHDATKANTPTGQAEPLPRGRGRPCCSWQGALAPHGPHRGRDATFTQLSSNPWLSALVPGVAQAGSPLRVPTKTGSSPTPPTLSSSASTGLISLGLFLAPGWILFLQEGPDAFNAVKSCRGCFTDAVFTAGH